MSVGWRIPEEKRELFKEPLGEFIGTSYTNDNANTIITVGDVVSLAVWESGRIPDLAIYDGKTERREMTDFAALVERQGLEKMVVKNPAGTITCSLDEAIKNALLNGPGLIQVEGEEDLALMPCILHSKPGTKIIYGWPGKGMMSITTDDIIREKTEQLWKEMEELE